MSRILMVSSDIVEILQLKDMFQSEESKCQLYFFGRHCRFYQNPQASQSEILHELEHFIRNQFPKPDVILQTVSLCEESEEYAKQGLYDHTDAARAMQVYSTVSISAPVILYASKPVSKDFISQRGFKGMISPETLCDILNYLI